MIHLQPMEFLLTELEFVQVIQQTLRCLLMQPDLRAES